MAYPNIEAILEEGGDITVGRVGPIECVASASTSYDCPVMLVRREGESFVALLRRLDRSIAKAWEQEITIDEVNGLRASEQGRLCRLGTRGRTLAVYAPG